MSEDTRHVSIVLPHSQATAIAMTVKCPECGVGIGQQCETKFERTPLDRPHWWRADEGVHRAVADKLEKTK